jgi:hypothetical protein
VVVEEVRAVDAVDVPAVDLAAAAAAEAAVEAAAVEEAAEAASVVDGRRAGRGLKGVSTPPSSGRVDPPVVVCPMY